MAKSSYRNYLPLMPFAVEQFDLTEYDERTLDFAKEYSRELLAIDINISVDKMLDTAWNLLMKFFSKEEVGIKQEFVDQYWKS